MHLRTLHILKALPFICTSWAFANIHLPVGMAFTGPIESVIPAMAGASELAINEANASGLFRGGETITTERIDTTCIFPQKALTNMQEAYKAQPFQFLIGPNCSGTTQALLDKFLMPNQILTVSPSATSPTLASPLFFRTVPADNRVAEALLEKLQQQSLRNISIAYINDGYGKGWLGALQASAKAFNITIHQAISYEDGEESFANKAVEALSSDDAENILIIGYLDQNGASILSKLLAKKQYTNYFLSDGMTGEKLFERINNPALFKNENVIGFVPGTKQNATGIQKFKALYSKHASIFTPESYDATALLILAMAKVPSLDPKEVASAMFSINEGAGEAIYPGEIHKGLEAIKNGKPIHYYGATHVNFDQNKSGNVLGNYQWYTFSPKGMISLND